MAEEALYLGVGAIIGGLIAFFVFKNSQSSNQANFDQVMKFYKEKFASDKEEIRSDLTNKRDQIKDLIAEIRRELKMAEEKVNRSDEKVVSSFSALQRELETHKQLTRELRGSTDDLKKILSNNQTRGAFGERVAEDLLKVAGFVVGQDYLVQTQSGVGRPDFTLLLPDGSKVNIDVKFPYANLQRYIDSQTETERKQYIEQFSRDVKGKIREIATREYINPEERTVDFAIIFVPSEMIFSYIYDQMNDVWEEAMSRKVILAGPYSFTAMLRLIKQAHSNFKIQSSVQQVVGQIQRFKIEFDKFNEEFDKVGRKIEDSARQFQSVSTTRTRQLNKVIDQIEATTDLKSKEPLLLEKDDQD